MSDYVRNKVVRCRATEELFGTTDPFEIEKNFEDLFSLDLGLPRFDVAPTEKGFIDLVLSHAYGEDRGDFGHARMLTEKELEVFLPYFRKIAPNVTAENLRYVDYCWYNCSEAPDYFEVEDDELDLDNFPRLE